jgi:hypothetical protein
MHRHRVGIAGAITTLYPPRLGGHFFVSDACGVACLGTAHDQAGLGLDVSHWRMHVELSGGLLRDATANHSYTFICRMGAWLD